MSWQLAVLRPWLRWTGRPVAARIRNWGMARRLFEGAAAVGFRRAHGVRADPLDADLAPGLWVRRVLDPAPGVVLFLHGGAYIVGSARIYRRLAGQLAARTGCPVCLPDYPLAPEHPAPAAFDAALRTWQGLMAAGYRPEEVVIAGDSAGGGLALSLLSHLVSRGIRPAGCAAFAPWTDLTLSAASLIANAPRDVLLPAERIGEVRDLVAGALDPRDPRVSPLFAPFPDCPPVHVTYSEAEILRDDAARMVEALRAQGAEVTCEILPNAPHVWQLFHGWLPEADASLDAVADFVTRALARSRASGS